MKFWLRKSKSETRDDELREYNRERVSEEISMALEQALQAEGVDSRADLARLLSCSRANITKLLVDNHNFKIHTLADIFLSLGFAFRPRITRHPDTLWAPLVEPDDIDESEITTPCESTFERDFTAGDSHVRSIEGPIYILATDDWKAGSAGGSKGTAGEAKFRYAPGRPNTMVRSNANLPSTRNIPARDLVVPSSSAGADRRRGRRRVG